MINVDTLAIVLRVLGRAPPPRSLAPAPVNAVPPASVVGSDVRPPIHLNTRSAPAHDSGDAVSSTEQHPPRTPDAPSSSGNSTIARAGVTPPGASNPVAISSAGTLLLDAMNIPQQERGPVIQARAPLLASSPHDPPALARAIEQAITRSGVFYESHVARWAANDFPLAELAHEPQASWAGSPWDGHASATVPGLVTPHEQAPLLLRQQLEAHEAHRLLLSAEVWPGQQATLQFEEPGHTREHAGGTSPREGERVWSTRIDVMLDSLGPVTAIVALRNGEIHCTLNVGTRDAHRRLADARVDLDAALRRQSLELSECAISHER